MTRPLVLESILVATVGDPPRVRFITPSDGGGAELPPGTYALTSNAGTPDDRLRLYVANAREGTIRALDVDLDQAPDEVSTTTRWQVPMPFEEGRDRFSGTYSDLYGRLYVTARSAVLAIDLTGDPSIEWHAVAEAGRQFVPHGGPALTDDGLVVAATEPRRSGASAGIVTFDVESGTVAWRHTAEGRRFSPPATTGQGGIVCTTAGPGGKRELLVLETDGALRFRTTLRDATEGHHRPPAPAIGPEAAYTVQKSGASSVGLSSGETRWTKATPLKPIPPVLTSECVLAAGRGKLVGFDRPTGDSTSVSAVIDAPPVPFEETVYTVGGDPLFLTAYQESTEEQTTTGPPDLRAEEG